MPGFHNNCIIITFNLGKLEGRLSQIIKTISPAPVKTVHSEGCGLSGITGTLFLDTSASVEFSEAANAAYEI